MFGDLNWHLNASRGLSAIAEFLVFKMTALRWRWWWWWWYSWLLTWLTDNTLSIAASRQSPVTSCSHDTVIAWVCHIRRTSRRSWWRGVEFVERYILATYIPLRISIYKKKLDRTEDLSRYSIFYISTTLFYLCLLFFEVIIPMLLSPWLQIRVIM